MGRNFCLRRYKMDKGKIREDAENYREEKNNREEQDTVGA